MLINHSLVPRILMGLLVAAYIVLGYFAYLLFYPFETITTKNEPFPVINSPVVAGTVVEYSVDYCRYTDVDAEVVRTLIGNVSISLGKTDGHFPKGCFKKTVGDSVIPSYTPPGQYYIQIDSNYKLNKLRSIEKHFHTATFTVVAPSAPVQQPSTPSGTTGFVPSSGNSQTATNTQSSAPTSSSTPTKSSSSPQEVATTPPPKASTPPVSSPPTTSSPPPPDNEGPVNRIVNGVLAPVTGVLQGVTSLLHP